MRILRGFSVPTRPNRRVVVRRGLVTLSVLLAFAPVATSATADDAEQAVATARPEATRTARGPAPEQPNIVAIMADDMRTDELRWMPHTRALLGRKGVTFRNSFSPYPLCCPARASFLTGQYAHNHQVWSHDEDFGFASFDDSSTLPTWLQEQGYRTGLVGKYLNGYGKQDTRGGSPSRTYVPPGWDDWRAAVEGVPDSSPFAGGTYQYFDTTLNVNGVLVGNEGVYQTPMLTEHVVSMIDRFSTGRQPFFVYASYVAPHHGKPGESDDPPRDLRRNDGAISAIKTPARPPWVRGRFDRLITEAPGYLPREDVRDKPAFIRRLPALNRRERRALTEAARQRAETLHILDLEVQRIVEALRARGELDDTVIMFTADNGYLLGEHRVRQGKILPYEPSLRVPLLMRGPGMPAGVRRFSPVTTLDLAPTFAALAGATPDIVVDGRSLLPLIERDRGWRTGVVTETGRRYLFNSEENAAGLAAGGRVVVGGRDPRFSLGLRTDRWLYVRHKNGEYELYDMAADEAQLVNVVDEPEYEAVRRSMARQLRELRNCVGAECRAPLAPSLRVPRRDIVSGRGR